MIYMTHKCPECIFYTKENMGMDGIITQCDGGEDIQYILPHGIETEAAAQAYLHSRDNGKSPAVSAKIAWSVQKFNVKEPRK